jgi:hypothetical protein
MNQYERLVQCENDPTFDDLRAMMETHEGMSPAKGARRGGGGKKRFAARKGPKVNSMLINDESTGLPLVRLHIRGLALETREHLRRHPGLARQYATKLAAQISESGTIPALPIARVERRVGLEVYGLTADEVALLKLRPRLLGDFLNATIMQEKRVEKTAQMR